MPGTYPIMRIPAEAPEDIEQMGSKVKFWFRHGEPPARWLFKYPREGSGEHWAEKVVAEIATLIEVPVARVELAEYEGRQGSSTLSFADRAQGRALIHGNELLAALESSYDKQKWHHQSEHTLDRIVGAVRAFFAGPAQKPALEQLAGYVVLDALVGNVDRHHENWGVVVVLEGGEQPSLHVAPSFDHASSLGRELNAQKCRQLLTMNDGVVGYMKRGHGGIFLKADDARGASPLALAVAANGDFPAYFAPWIERLRKLDIVQVEGIIQRIPDGWMAPESREFALAFVRRARQLLLGAVP